MNHLIDAADLLERFCRYVRLDTRSDAHFATCPSTPGQWDLLRLLETELRELGAAEVRLTADGYVLATVPATSLKPRVPRVAWFGHVDTATELPGDAKPMVHRRYDGRPIVLPDDPSQQLTVDATPHLREKIGHDVVTASGTTLLGADDKSGVAVVMSAVRHLLRHPEIPHGVLRICFNPDEEIARGMTRLDLGELAEQFGEPCRPRPGGDDVEVPLHGKGGEGVVARRVERVVMVEQLDDDVLATEAVDEPVQLSFRRDGPGFDERLRHRPLAATGEDEEVAPRELGQPVDVVTRAPLLATGEMALGDGAGKTRVAGRIPGDDYQVGAGRIGRPGARGGRGGLWRKAGAMAGEGELGPEDGGHPRLLCRLGEAHDAVEAVVVGERQTRQAQTRRLGHQFLGVARPVEETEARVGVQFGVGRHQS